MYSVIPEVGGRWDKSSLLWQGRGGRGSDWKQTSPLDGSVIQAVSLLDREELDAIVAWDTSMPTGGDEELRAFCLRLHAALCGLAPLLEDAMLRETAFIRPDCREMVAAGLEFVQCFPDVVSEADAGAAPIHYDVGPSRRQIRLSSSPWGTIAVILPQNAFLVVALTCLLNALHTGNRVILRAPQQSARSAALLATAIKQAQPPPRRVSVVLTRARDFVEALCASDAPCLIHYMGSSAHAPSIMAQAFESGKGAIVDGQGNGWVYVAEDVDLGWAAEVLTCGALRYNGQTCTSINGAIIAPTIYPVLRERLRDAWDQIPAGNPLTEDVAVGPLLDEAQAEHCLDIFRQAGANILCGGSRVGNLLEPTLVETSAPESRLVREGFFGCALWIAKGTSDDFASWWRRNRYPLCAGVLSASAEPSVWQARLSNLARLTVNGDPSVEHIHEPWGGYAASGSNPVSLWKHKYERVIQIDQSISPQH